MLSHCITILKKNLFQDGNEYVIKLWNFEQIQNVLKAAGDHKCREAQACLEGIYGTVTCWARESFG